MLKTVNRPKGLMLVKSKQSHARNILVGSVNVGIGMMIDIVLHLPAELVAADHVDRGSKQTIDPGLVRKRIVAGIVHHTHSDTGQGNAQPDKNQHGRPPRHGHGDQKR